MRPKIAEALCNERWDELERRCRRELTDPALPLIHRAHFEFYMAFVVEEPQGRIQETLRLIKQMEALQAHEESCIAREQGIQFPLPRELSCAVSVPSLNTVAFHVS